MKPVIFKIFMVSVVILNITQLCNCAPNQNLGRQYSLTISYKENYKKLYCIFRTLADNYTALTDDVKWFFRGVSNIAGTLERMLPNVTTNQAKTR